MLGLNKIPGWTANVKAIGMKPGTAEMVVVACIVVAVVAVGAGVAWAAASSQRREAEGMETLSQAIPADCATEQAALNREIRKLQLAGVKLADARGCDAASISGVYFAGERQSAKTECAKEAKAQKKELAARIKKLTEQATRGCRRPINDGPR